MTEENSDVDNVTDICEDSGGNQTVIAHSSDDILEMEHIVSSADEVHKQQN